MNWKSLFMALMLCAVGTTPAIAQVQSSFAGEDLTAIDKIASDLFQKIRQGKPIEAVKSYMGKSPLFANKEGELQALANEVTSTVEYYGPISNCDLVEEKVRGNFVVQRLYICQHDFYNTRWILVMIKTTRGWVGAKLDYDDKILLPLSD